MLELDGIQRHQVRPAVEPGHDVHFGDELVLAEVERDHRAYRFEVVRVLGDDGVEVAQTADRVECGFVLNRPGFDRDLRLWL